MKPILFAGLYSLVTGMMFTSFAYGVPIEDFKKEPVETRANFISGGISVLTFQYALDGKKEKLKCVYDWFFKF